MTPRTESRLFRLSPSGLVLLLALEREGKKGEWFKISGVWRAVKPVFSAPQVFYSYLKRFQIYGWLEHSWDRELGADEKCGVYRLTEEGREAANWARRRWGPALKKLLEET